MNFLVVGCWVFVLVGWIVLFDLGCVCWWLVVWVCCFVLVGWFGYLFAWVVFGFGFVVLL